MLNKREAIHIILAWLTLSLTFGLVRGEKEFFISLPMILVVIFGNILAKKISSSHFDAKIKIKLWEVKRYWFRPHDYFKSPVPLGIVLPFILLVLTQGALTWFACLVFDTKAKLRRVAKRHGFRSFSEMTEKHTALIAGAGILANILLAFVGLLLNFPIFAKLNLYYSLFNLIPISNLDGNKIFLGNFLIWAFLLSLTLIGLISLIAL